jgi:hypothetical protein
MTRLAQHGLCGDDHDDQAFYYGPRHGPGKVGGRFLSMRDRVNLNLKKTAVTEGEAENFPLPPCWVKKASLQPSSLTVDAL